jgi:hypothetical protein
MVRGCVQTGILHCYHNLNQRMHIILSKPQYCYNSEALTCFGAFLAHHQREYSPIKLLRELVYCNIFAVLIKLCAFVASNCDNWIKIHGMEKAKCCIMFSNGASNWHVKQSRMRRPEMNVGPERFENKQQLSLLVFVWWLTSFYQETGGHYFHASDTEQA